jgi:hypothetical protein
MSSSGFTPQFLTALEEAIAQGVLTLSYEGKTVTYRSLPDMLETRKPVRLVAGRWS